MGTSTDAELDGWLREGGMVVTSSDRAARAFQSAFHHRRRAEGLTAWPTPNILDWNSFARTAWEERHSDDRLLLNSAQEEALWADIIRDHQHLSTVLPASVHRLADLAMSAYELLCSYSSRHLLQAARLGWEQDPGTFSNWLTAFEETCTRNRLLSPSRLPLELIPMLQAERGDRAPLRTAGFDRLLPIQAAVFDAWGKRKQFVLDDPAQKVAFYETTDSRAELEACALWCNRQTAANPNSRLLIVTQDIPLRRGEIERALLRFTKSVSPPLFEFSLGIPLRQVPLARGAHLLLRWLEDALEESELDWLLSSGLAASPGESTDLQAYVRALRHRGLQRTQWPLQAFVNPAPVSLKLPPLWTQRMVAAQRQLREIGNKPQSPLEWADKVPRLLQSMGWPGDQHRGSAAFQSQRRWQQALDTAASLGFDGRRIGWSEFLSSLDRALEETLFAPESLDAPIQIAGPAESAGLTADAIWFLGADEEAWPALGSMHPLLPPHVQREAEMPHTTLLHDWEFSAAVTKRLVSSAREVQFSFARQREAIETRPSRLVSQVAGPPQPMPPGLAPAPIQPPATIAFSDSSRIPFRQESLQGGSSVLTAQSQCPFKAFATARLGAQDWEPAEVGLSAAQRGQLLHAVLHAIWAGPPAGIRSLDDLLALSDRKSFVQRHVQKVLREEVPQAVRDNMPRRYLDLEEQRLVGVLTEWLAFEASRIPFTVAETEAKHTINPAGFTLNLRLDRIDRLNDGSLLVIDYKTGNVSPRDWDLPRPEDVQLPLYAGFGLDGELGGLVFAKVRTGEQAFAGRVGDAKKTLLRDLSNMTSLVKEPLTAERLIDWREYIEQLARDFVAGRADVDPRDYPKTCERCGLQAVCRISEVENRRRLDEEREADVEETEDD